MNYREAITDDARDFLEDQKDTVLEALKDSRPFWDFFSEADDNGAFHEQVVDRSYSLTEAAEILDNCQDVETDSGLWRDMDPREAISAMAAFSYANDVRGALCMQYEDLLSKQEEALEALEEAHRAKVSALEDQEASTMDEIESYFTSEINRADLLYYLQFRLAKVRKDMEDLYDEEQEFPEKAAAEAWKAWKG